MGTNEQDNVAEAERTRKQAAEKSRGAQISFGRIAKLYLLKLLRPAPDRWLELALAASIVIVAAVQLFTTISNNKGTSQQTDQLISAAKISAYASQQNAQASRNFADSAKGINQGVTDAVDKLSLQARRTEEARESSVEQSSKALTATINNFHLDQRAWIGNCGVSLAQFEAGRPIRVEITMCNTGRTPALHVSQGLAWTLTAKALPGPSAEMLKSVFFVPGSAISPAGRVIVGGGDLGGGTPLIQKQIDDGKLLDSHFVEISSGKLFMYWYGSLQYEDVSHERHVTYFCTYLANPITKQMASCNEYNDMK